MALKSSSTLRAVLADVSMKKSPLSFAYSLASDASTLRLLARSHLFPARAMTMLGLWRREKRVKSIRMGREEEVLRVYMSRETTCFRMRERKEGIKEIH